MDCKAIACTCLTERILIVSRTYRQGVHLLDIIVMNINITFYKILPSQIFKGGQEVKAPLPPLKEALHTHTHTHIYIYI